MNLEIINNKGVFEIHGYFTKENSTRVAEYFSDLLDTYYEVVICLKKVKSIDLAALHVLQSITKKAEKRSKVLFVLGKENKRIKKAFINSDLVGIFKNEYAA